MIFNAIWDRYVTIRNFAILTAAFTLVFCAYIVIAADAEQVATQPPESPYGDYMKYVNIILLAVIGYLLREGVIALKSMVTYVFKMFKTVEGNQIRIENIDRTLTDIVNRQNNQETRLTKLERPQKN